MKPARKTLLLLTLPLLFTALASTARAIDEIPRACSPSKDRDSYISLTADKLVIGNRNMEAVIAISSKTVSPSVVTNKINNGRVVTSEEFSFTLMDGTKVGSSDFEYAGRIPQEFENGRCKLTVSYRSKTREIDAQAVFWLTPNSNVLRKYIRLKSSGGETDIDSLTLGVLKPSDSVEGGGLGQPVFFDRLFFAGIEFPAGYNIVENGAASFSHYPGWKLSGEWKKSKTLAIGAAPYAQAEDSFNEYVKSISLKPRPFVVYNSWFDVRRDTMSVDKLKHVFGEYSRNLSPYGVKLDSFVIDDGWQDPDALWVEDKRNFPDGLDGLSAYLRASGTPPGLWLPLCGYGLSLPFGNKNGYEAALSGGYFCLAGDKYRTALKKSLARLILDLGVNYFKHDFNFLSCKGAGPGMRPTEKQSVEANTDAQIEMLSFMRSLKPDVFLNVTSYIWLSPWWLPYSDALWIDSSDYGYSESVPIFSSRERSSLYYDEYVYKRLRTEGARVPLHTLMTHGIIDGVHNRLGGTDENFLSWSDGAMAYLGRGVMMRELYLSPELMGAQKWGALGEMLRWADSRTETFTNGRMLGASPSTGKPFWYQFDGGTTDLFTIRNPGYRARAQGLTLRHPGNLVRFIYPIRMYMMPHFIGANGYFDVDLFDNETAVLESVRPDSLKRPVVLGIRARMTGQTETETEYEVGGIPSKFVFKISSPVHVREVLFEGRRVEPDESGYYRAELKPTTAEQAEEPMSPFAFSSNNPFSSTIDTIASTTRYMTEPKMIMTIRTESPVAPAKFEMDGKIVQATATGNGWVVAEFPLSTGTEIHQFRFDPAIVAMTPFASGSFFVDFLFNGYYRAVTGKITIRHDPAPEEHETLPPAPMQELMKYLSTSIDGELYDFTGMIETRKYPADKNFTPAAAKLFIRVLGSKPGGVPAMISINGAPAGAVPYTSYPHEEWENHIIDIPQNALRALKKSNKVKISNTASAPFTFTSLALSVQMTDRSWLNTPFDASVQNTADAAAKTVTLEFP